MKIFYLFFGLYIFANVYVFIELRRLIGPGLWQWLAGLWFAAMIALWALRFGLPSRGMLGYLEDVGFIWIGVIMITLLCFVIVDIAAILLKFASLASDNPLTRLLAGARRPVVALVAGIALSVYAVIEAQNIGVSHYAIATSKLPPGTERLRIAMLSDIHVSDFIGKRMLAKIAALVEAEHPDMLVVVGDLIDTDVSKNTESSNILASIVAPAGKFAVSGNHEAYRGMPDAELFIKRSQLTLLQNRMVEAGGVMVAGIDDVSVVERYGGIADPVPMLEAYRQGGGKNFVLLLKHRPTGLKYTRELFDLQLSGHTHGGQIWPGRFIVKYLHDNLAQGLTEFTRDDGSVSRLIISNGTGFWGPPMRLFAPPEVVIVDLVAE